jgi:hypothetical protein
MADVNCDCEVDWTSAAVMFQKLSIIDFSHCLDGLSAIASARRLCVHAEVDHAAHCENRTRDGFASTRVLGHRFGIGLAGCEERR